MNKILIENAYLLSASLKDEVKKEGEKWVPTGSKKIELQLLTDVVDDKLQTGKVRFLSNAKDPNFNIEEFYAKLHRFDRLTLLANMYEYGDRTDYRFYKVSCDGVLLTESTGVDDSDLPF